MKRLYMETTRIPAERTAQEIGTLLAKSGANQVLTEYAKGKIRGLRWTMLIDNRTVPFSMPVRTKSVFTVLQARRRSAWNYEENDAAQAERVAWRQLLRWVQAQLAMIETGMVEAAEVFLPYIQVNEHQTLFQRMKESGMKMLPAGKV